MKRSRALFLLQLLLGIALLGLLFLREEQWAKVLLVLADFQWSYFPLLLFFSFLFIAISSAKWQLFLRERNIELPLGRFMKLYTIGIFFNNFVPTMIGGDIARSYLLGRRIESQTRSAASVFLERFTGLIALVVLAGSSVIINPSLSREPLVMLSVSLVGGGSLLLLALILWPEVWQELLAKWSHVRLLAWIEQIGRRMHGNVSEIKDNPQLFRMALGYSIAFHLLAGLNAYVAALAIGFRPDLLKVLTLTPLILLVASVPLTPNSIGLFEWAFSVYLVPAGLTPEGGLAVAVIVRAKNLAVSILGGLFFLTERASASRSMELPL